MARRRQPLKSTYRAWAQRGINMTPRQFEVLRVAGNFRYGKLYRCHEAARMVLVEGRSQREAASEVDADLSSLSYIIGRYVGLFDLLERYAGEFVADE